MSEKKFKFNIIDAVIILVLVAAIAVLAYVFVFSDDSEVNGDVHTVEYVVEVSSLNRELFHNAVKEGDLVTFDADREVVLGHVTTAPLERTSIKTEYDNETGKEVYTEAPGLIDMTITFQATAVETEWGYCIDDEAYITVNNTNEFIIGELRCVALCTEVTVLD